MHRNGALGGPIFVPVNQVCASDEAIEGCIHLQKCTKKIHKNDISPYSSAIASW